MYIHIKCHVSGWSECGGPGDGAAAGVCSGNDNESDDDSDNDDDASSPVRGRGPLSLLSLPRVRGRPQSSLCRGRHGRRGVQCLHPGVPQPAVSLISHLPNTNCEIDRRNVNLVGISNQFYKS